MENSIEYTIHLHDLSIKKHRGSKKEQTEQELCSRLLKTCRGVVDSLETDTYLLSIHSGFAGKRKEVKVNIKSDETAKVFSHLWPDKMIHSVNISSDNYELSVEVVRKNTYTQGKISYLVISLNTGGSSTEFMSATDSLDQLFKDEIPIKYE